MERERKEKIKGKKEGRKDDGWVVGTPILLGHQWITVNLAG